MIDWGDHIDLELIISAMLMSNPVDSLHAATRRLTQFFITLAMLTCCFNLSPSDAGETSGPHMSEPWWQERFHEKQVQLHEQPIQLVFLGDSIFHSFEWDPRAPVWNHWYGGRGAVNLGFNGDGTADVIWRIRHGELDGLSPRLAVILIGTNDLGKPPAEVASSIEDLAKAVSERSAATKILVLGILPNGQSGSEKQLGRDVNARLEAVFQTPGALANFQDLSCLFLQDGKLNTGLFRERAVPGHSYPLHPTPQGMQLIAASIEPIVAAALGDRPRTTSGDLRGTDCPQSGH